MSDIFISYASADRSRIRPLVDALGKQGWSVWWDRSILPGKAWENEIEKALLDTKCVIVLWSHNSIQSDWVRTEANVDKSMVRVSRRGGIIYLRSYTVGFRCAGELR